MVADHRHGPRQRGDDPNELPHRYADFINKVVAHKPAGMTLAMHLCRGNFKSHHFAAGNYEPVAEALLSEMHIDAYFLEYDDDRSGDFRPLRFLPKGKLVVLGLVTTKFGQLESKDSLKRRIDEAARYAKDDIRWLLRVYTSQAQDHNPNVQAGRVVDSCPQARAAWCRGRTPSRTGREPRGQTVARHRPNRPWVKG